MANQELERRLAEAKNLFARLRAAVRRADAKKPCPSYAAHEFLVVDCVVGASIGTDAWLRRNGVPLDSKGAWGGYQELRCLACGERYLTDYCGRHPIKLKPKQKVL